MSLSTKLRLLRIFPILLLYNKSVNKSKIDEDLMQRKFFLNRNYSREELILSAFYDPYYRVILFDRLGKFKGLLQRVYPVCNSFIIHPKSIGEGIVPFHCYATILNAKQVGKGLRIRQCTTIGNKSDDKPDEKPIIGNNVSIGANTVIIGNITIGDNAIIGAGSVVLTDVPANSVYAGNPARLIKNI